jgi:hypothetical protein
VLVRDLSLPQRVADAFLATYGSDWAFEVRRRRDLPRPWISLVYEAALAQALGVGNGDPFSDTCWGVSAAVRADPLTRYPGAALSAHVS